MPVQGSWVELWLSRYCPPGRHRFRAFRAGVVLCDICKKEELVGGETCLFCGLPGQRASAVVADGDPGRVFTGKLCGPCLDEFEQRRTIRGWTLAS